MKKFDILFEEVCTSTNDIAKTLPLYTAVYAGRQTKGRGRMGRTWQDGRGNLMASIVLPSEKQAHLYSFLSSLAVAQSLAFLSPRIKWPNDVLVDGKKVCGILLESFEDKLIIGIGVNIETYPLTGMLYQTTSLKAEGYVVEARKLLENILQNLSFVIENFEKKGFASVRLEWLEFACGLGKMITVSLPNETVQGVFEGVDEDGALILAVGGDLRRLITAGDVFMIGERNDEK